MAPTLYFLCGLPGSGKTTFAEQLASEYNAVIFSSDKIRQELSELSPSEDSNAPVFNARVFTTLHSRVRKALLSGRNVVYDATNINSKRRMAFLRELKHVPCEKHCYVVARQYHNCLKANAERNSPVPAEVIATMYRNWHTPYYFEGWDRISASYTDNDMGALGDSFEVTERYKDFDQDNPHHTFTLGEHMIRTWEEVKELVSISALSGSDKQVLQEVITEAALIHDCGKPFTRSYAKYRKNPSAEAHYYNHQNVGAYDALFLKTNNKKNILIISVLVNLHMFPLFWSKLPAEQREKHIDKYKKLWGNEIFLMVKLLGKADRLAH